MQSHIDKLKILFEDLDRIFPEYKYHFKYKKLKKGDYLLKEGKICNHFWYIEEGLVRCFYRKESNEVVTYFGNPGMFIYSTQSYILKQPCKDNIQAITDAIVYSIKRSDFDTLCLKYPILKEIDKLMSEIHIMWLEERLFSIQFCTARERYDKLMQAEPFLIQQIPVTHLASFLGITIETLSRIRAKIK